MAQSYTATLRERLAARQAIPFTEDVRCEVPAAGIIPDQTIAMIDLLARQAREGEIAARDRLYAALAPRLHRKGYILRPWPNTPLEVGIWDRDDVDQEGWIVFAELVSGWDGEMPFLPYLFARYPWRLRDRILRGIGKPLPRIGEVRVPADLLAEVLSASDSDQPESALIAHNLLEHMLQVIMCGDIDMHVPLSLMSILRSPQWDAIPVATTLPDDGHPFSQIEAA